MRKDRLLDLLNDLNKDELIAVILDAYNENEEKIDKDIYTLDKNISDEDKKAITNLNQASENYYCYLEELKQKGKVLNDEERFRLFDLKTQYDNALKKWQEQVRKSDLEYDKK